MSLGDGVYVDGSWELSILVDDLQLTRRLRVNGETHIGGLMLRLVEAIDVRMDWSDHGLWWPAHNRWLLKTRHTLDQCGVQADAKLEFHRMHGYARVQLPDLQEIEMRLSFAQTVFAVVVSACRELGIRHPEELSLQADGLQGAASCDGNNGDSGDSSSGSLLRTGHKKKSPSSPMRPSPSPRSAASLGSLGGSLGDCIDGGGSVATLADSPRVKATSTASPRHQRGNRRPPRTPLERAVASGVESWLDSSRSLMEQGLRPCGDSLSSGPLRLRFKFHAHYDLNPQLDAVRINQLYEQAKWSVLIGEQQCTEEEAMLLAALQLQAQLGARPNEPAAGSAGSALNEASALVMPSSNLADADAQLDAEIDADLAQLEASLSLSPTSASDGVAPSVVASTIGRSGAASAPIEAVPELASWLKVSSGGSGGGVFATLTLRGGADSGKRRYLILRELQLLVCSDDTEAGRTEPVAELSLAGAEVMPDTAGGRLSIRLLPSSGSSTGWWRLKFGGDNARRQFAEWSAGLSLAARGRTLASQDLFTAEVRDILARLELQCPTIAAVSEAAELSAEEVVENLDPTDYLPPAVLKSGGKPRALARQILERRARVLDRSRLDAKLDYIRAWQRLPMSGVTYFCVYYSEQQPGAPVSFDDFRRERRQQKKQNRRPDLFGVAFNRIMRLNPLTGDALATWRYHELDSWTVNWEMMSLSASLNRPPHYMCLTPCPSNPALKLNVCKTLAEYIGGYVFLSLRKPEKSQLLDERMFQKLTCGRDAVSA
ncbi:hypothetical protein BOX15_Mlig029525g1 [Macrostomum lignano]|uniref:Band 4.1 domain-containing protein n=1 Tax=Macrostomum lignano TaxID=282301 RepID=A0A267H4E1_9PLAT|nr:hypothetical protein BOX15_Mlig029525g3 [Macrostomum lignano]PAA92378.1 hypothetical protein BOX15_Mlig029525g2 [Macrostomum lignano]PAA92432.1 hypothetical protein BOX15_Mlig029525g1 [Macrostomum lignano]